MKQQIDYINLMHEQSEIGEGPTRFSVYGDGDKPKLLNDGTLSFLFVLQGELMFVFQGGARLQLKSLQMTVVDKAQIRELLCVGDTVVLEYVQSDKMSPIMRSTSNVFNTPYFEIITLNSNLKAWCRSTFRDLTECHNRSSNYCTML